MEIFENGRLVVLPPRKRRPLSRRPVVTIAAKRVAGKVELRIVIVGLSRADASAAREALEILKMQLSYETVPGGSIGESKRRFPPAGKEAT
jgi:hypothetical protein